MVVLLRKREYKDLGNLVHLFDQAKTGPGAAFATGGRPVRKLLFEHTSVCKDSSERACLEGSLGCHRRL